MKYNKLTFISENGKSKDGHILWKCICDCGEICINQASKIRLNKITQCKKCSLKNFIQKISKHGMRNSSEYSSWRSMKDRCLNKNNKDFPNYGAKGITIYEPWIHSFEEFYKHIGKKLKGQSIDRIDNSKGYEPDNVRWADRPTQQRNKSNSLWINWKGKKTHIVDVAKDLGITKSAAHLRYKRGKIYD